MEEGGGAIAASPYYGCPGFPFNASILTSAEKTNAGKNVVYIRKRKMGIVTSSIDTVKVYPYQTFIYTVNW